MTVLPFEHIFTVLLFAWVILIAVLWLRQEMRSRKRDWPVFKEKLYFCSHCRHSFLEDDAAEDEDAAVRRETIVRCPHCHEMCFMKRRKHL